MDPRPELSSYGSSVCLSAAPGAFLQFSSVSPPAQHVASSLSLVLPPTSYHQQTQLPSTYVCTRSPHVSPERTAARVCRAVSVHPSALAGHCVRRWCWGRASWQPQAGFVAAVQVDFGSQHHHREHCGSKQAGVELSASACRGPRPFSATQRGPPCRAYAQAAAALPQAHGPTHQAPRRCR